MRFTLLASRVRGFNMGKQLHEPVTIASSDARAARKSSSVLRDVFSSRRRMLNAAAWLLLLLAAFSAATFAWFSSSRYTNVTPVAHTVSDSGYDLLIGASQGGPFDTECALSQADKMLYPISTADLTSFWRGTFQNANGITTEYANCTANVDDYALTGTFYLKGQLCSSCCVSISKPDERYQRSSAVGGIARGFHYRRQFWFTDIYLLVR